MTPPDPDAPATLFDLLDRMLETGIVADGELRVTVADVPLLFIGLRALVCAVEQAEQLRPLP